MKNTKSAKDIAFERERIKLQGQKRALEEQLRDRDKTIKNLESRISELESINDQKDEWIERLLKYTEISKEDLIASIEKDKAVAEAAKSLGIFMKLSNGLYY